MSLFGWPAPTLRLAVFAGVLVLLMLAQSLWPRRSLHQAHHRWRANLGLLVLGALLLRLMAALSVPLTAMAAAQWAQQQGFGLLHQLHLAGWRAWLLTLLALDAMVWVQHWLFHQLPLFWRLHRVHHADQEIDVSTALRFHPLEIAVSMLIKVVAVLLLGASAEAVLVFEVLLNACAMFNHANLRLPLVVDRALRWLIVTPDMHRVHHSVVVSEQQRNFGFCLSLWDRLSGLYQPVPQLGHEAMQIGLAQHQGSGPSSLGWSLLLPLKKT